MMSFVQTSIGMSICTRADMLLKKLNRKKVQYVKSCPAESCEEVLTAELESGGRFVDKIYCGHEWILLIMEREE